MNSHEFSANFHSFSQYASQLAATLRLCRVMSQLAPRQFPAVIGCDWVHKSLGRALAEQCVKCDMIYVVYCCLFTLCCFFCMFFCSDLNVNFSALHPMASHFSFAICVVRFKVHSTASLGSSIQLELTIYKWTRQLSNLSNLLQNCATCQ